MALTPVCDDHPIYVAIIAPGSSSLGFWSPLLFYTFISGRAVACKPDPLFLPDCFAHFGPSSPPRFNPRGCAICREPGLSAICLSRLLSSMKPKLLFSSVFTQLPFSLAPPWFPGSDRFFFGAFEGFPLGHFLLQASVSLIRLS